MKLALLEAEQALLHDDVPIGAVLVGPHGEFFADHNRREVDFDPTAHAEIVVLRKAAKALRTWRLEGFTCVVTLEPCPMCAGALVNARVARLVFGCNDLKAGASRTLFQITDDPRLNHRLEVCDGVLADECRRKLQQFFSQRRGPNRRPPLPRQARGATD